MSSANVATAFLAGGSAFAADKQGSTMGALGWIVLTIAVGAIVALVRHKVGKEIERGCPL
jgi:hypothetical protein